MNDSNTRSNKNATSPRRSPGRPDPLYADKPGLEARAAAVKLLGAVVDRKTSLDGMLDAEHGNPAYMALDDADRSLVRAILQTTLRYLPRIEAVIGSLLDSPLPSGARSLQHVLAVGVAQILYLDVPDHSAVDLSVELANRDSRNRRFAKLANAILRRVVREKQALLDEFAAVVCVPDWFFERMVKAYGEERAHRIADAQLVPAAIDLTVKSEPERWAERLEGVVLPTGGVRLAAGKGAITGLEGFEGGDWWVQDAAASIPARLFPEISGMRIADLCAAPGGKTAQLALAGADVTAVEQSANRLKRLKENLGRLGMDVEFVQSDLMKFEPEQAFDAVLLDAPCSSTGTTRRHPDVLWAKGPEDIEKLAGVQERLLRKALTLVRPGGYVVFSNCSLDPIEGEELVDRVLRGSSDYARHPIQASDWPGLEAAITPLGEFRTTPDMLQLDGAFASGMDGFYACVIRRDL